MNGVRKVKITLTGAGDIKIALPIETKANLVMETMTGTSYSDLDIKIIRDIDNEKVLNEIIPMEHQNTR